MRGSELERVARPLELLELLLLLELQLPLPLPLLLPLLLAAGSARAASRGAASSFFRLTAKTRVWATAPADRDAARGSFKACSDGAAVRVWRRRGGGIARASSDCCGSRTSQRAPAQRRCAALRGAL